MSDLIELSSRIVDEGILDIATTRVTNELSELADDLAIVESFSHSVALRTAEGLVCFDASGVHTGAAVVAAIGRWSPLPIHSLIYTHGHADHVGGSAAFAAAAAAAGHQRPLVVAHRNVAARIERYERTNDWNLAINQRQFGGIAADLQLSIGGAERRFLPHDTMLPDETFDEQRPLSVGGIPIELHHAKGETDDHLWAWLPEQRWIIAGDFFIWNFPNAGNPQKVQRYPAEWAAALRQMIAQQPELIVPAHGLPIAGRQRIASVLNDVATALETLVWETLAMMNDGATLDTIIHSVTLDGELMSKPYLRPFYDEPEFVIRNIWRLYGGWWDGAASRLKPSPDAQLAAVLSELAGGPLALVSRAESAMNAGDLRLACHLVDIAGLAAPDDAGVHRARFAVYEARRLAEPSLMAKGIFRAAARESAAKISEIA
jgi:alkyl sulfatase BDS1-like metallo-beta-lactamase superfamily hydrolase